MYKILRAMFVITVACKQDAGSTGFTGVYTWAGQNVNTPVKNFYFAKSQVIEIHLPKPLVLKN